jgi:hypothetical protein
VRKSGGDQNDLFNRREKLRQIKQKPILFLIIEEKGLPQGHMAMWQKFKKLKQINQQELNRIYVQLGC